MSLCETYIDARGGTCVTDLHAVGKATAEECPASTSSCKVQAEQKRKLGVAAEDTYYKGFNREPSISRA